MLVSPRLRLPDPRILFYLFCGPRWTPRMTINVAPSAAQRWAGHSATLGLVRTDPCKCPPWLTGAKREGGGPRRQAEGSQVHFTDGETEAQMGSSASSTHTLHPPRPSVALEAPARLPGQCPVSPQCHPGVMDPMGSPLQPPASVSG
jgi:hypothetical protein